jgi:hypothetical protein
MVKLARIEARPEASAAESADKLEKAVELTARRGPETARDPADAARKASDQALETAREVARAGGAAIEAGAERQREAMQTTGREVAGLASAVARLVSEQTQENLRLATALAGTTDWHELARLQREFWEGSFNRASQFGERYRTAWQELFSSAAIASRR